MITSWLKFVRLVLIQWSQLCILSYKSCVCTATCDNQFVLSGFLNFAHPNPPAAAAKPVRAQRSATHMVFTFQRAGLDHGAATVDHSNCFLNLLNCRAEHCAQMFLFY